MKSILIAGLGLAISTAALAETGPKFSVKPVITYDQGHLGTSTLYSVDFGGLKSEAILGSDGTARAVAPLQTVSGPDLKTWEWAYYYDIKSRDSAVVVLKPLYTVTSLLGVKNLNLNIEGFGGVSLETGRMLAGAGGIFKGKIADQVWLGVGPAFTFQNDRPGSFGVLGTVQVKF